MKAIVWSAAAAAVLCMSAPAQAQVNTNQSGAYGSVTLTRGFTPDPHSASLTAGGTVDASTVSDECVGHIASRADYSVRYRRAGEGVPLIFSATSDADTTLAIRAPDGQWYCNDDSDGLNPVVRFDAPRNGRYQVWVGTYGEDSAPATLNVSEIAVVTAEPTGGDVPDFSLDPAYGVIDLVSGFTPDPHTVAIQAGGELNASALGGTCLGFVARAPDYRVNWTAGSGSLPLIFSVTAESDTVLVINDAEGNWVCDDDGGNEGLNPAITFTNPVGGQYDIWVGTYSDGPLAPSTLSVSELYSE